MGKALCQASDPSLLHHLYSPLVNKAAENMFHTMTIEGLCATFLTVFQDKVHQKHMKQAPVAPFIGGYLQGTTIDQNNDVAIERNNTW